MTTVDILQVAHEPIWLVLCETPVQVGFPSTVEDQKGEEVGQNKTLLPNPLHTYLARVNGTGMEGPPSNIADGTLLTVDCSIKPQVGHVVVAAINDDFIVKRLEKRGNTYWLAPDNPNHPAIEIRGKDHVQVWGVVTHVVTKLTSGVFSSDVYVRPI
jgi:DNA polymerase V